MPSESSVGCWFTVNMQSFPHWNLKTGFTGVKISECTFKKQCLFTLFHLKEQSLHIYMSVVLDILYYI